ncbi:glucose 1-dehydrogenase [Pseudalkalibacillus decolorationis]|uniref:glucose 1-dehydrogenase n=1 Tax=Pseudalkalibacillus decolorationis TaxID=163879 RepID=UPI002148F720|nr:glucose 1-dehydrogenase [Pseudalkalibacillus decolorationis]
MRLKDKVTVITGAGSGIGEATAFLFAREGAKVVLTDINEETGKATLLKVKNKGGNAIFIQHDVTNEEGWKNVYNIVISKFDQVDVLVNNAGIAMQASVEDCTYEQWKRIHEVNLDGVFLGTKYGIVAMKANNRGSIINISSIEGNIAEPHLAAYNSSKGGVRQLSKSAALHCAKSNYGIRVNSVHPGYLHTPMHARFSEKQVRQIESLHPMGHLGEAIDVAYGILYLASDESKFITGTELIIDGGYTAQ